MKKVLFYDWTAAQTIELVTELRQRGLKQGIDFDFEYHPSQNSFTGYADAEFGKHAVFIFYKDSLATWFELTYR